MKKPTISLCMIVKNEEKVLTRCLESVKGYVDELVIVDTGSTDSTVDIATSYGAKVVHYAWTNDFGDARNQALDKATGDWILQLDADEYFIDGTQSKLLENIERHHDKDGFLIQITNLIGTGQLGNTHVYTRLFKNHEQVRYEGKIHEQVKKDGVVINGEWSDIRIVHTGYMTEVVKEKGKQTRNMTLLRNELAKNPASGFHNYNISNEYIGRGQYKKALEHAKKAFHYGKGSSYQSNAVLNIIWSLYHLERYEEALTVLDSATKTYHHYTDLVFIEGLVLEKQGRLSEAKAVFRKCIELGEADKRYYSKKGIGSLIPTEKLAGYALSERQFDEASQYFTLLLGLNQKSLPYAIHLCTMLRREMSDAELYTYIETAFKGDEYDSFRETLYTTIGVKEGIANLPDKERVEIDIEVKRQWFRGNVEEATSRCLEGLRVFKKRMLPTAIALYASHPSDSLYQAISSLNKTAALMVRRLNGETSFKKMNYQSEIYVSTMKELIELKHYDAFETLYSLKNVFQPRTLKELANVLAHYFYDDIAVECYVEYVQTNDRDVDAWVRASELLFHLGHYEDALALADASIQRGNISFRPIEIIVESLKQMEQLDEMHHVCQQAFKRFPQSTYLIEAIEGTA